MDPFCPATKFFQAHHDECKFNMVECRLKCGVTLEARYLKKHMEKECPRRIVACDFCADKMEYDEELEHLNTCPKLPVTCPNGCQTKNIARADRLEMRKHEENGAAAARWSARCGGAASKVTYDMQRQVTNIDAEVQSFKKLYGSQLLWKIDKYGEKLHDAKSGKKTTIYSPPFMTSRYGYKMAMSACPNGDGRALGKFVSVFICLCKGDYDSLNAWPFGHKVTFTMIDQCEDPNARKNIVFTVRPNAIKENQAFLGRPIAERNASFGTQKFCL
ncbi:PREDICTED: TNF receptor-associated factor 4-like [Priapulus caudatus]|uniref:TNF receptor-associated factor 4-like n=1 Tax=Priapulus caudatus TaxID=37621 RepID=A0ABM1DYC4_PRICU|nr:PREDICTED: TNF receptor-associated factor 4-like [Priapulus caudatus]